MNIYVDFDDCLCETGRAFSVLVKELFDMDVPYESMAYFNLQKSFNLDDEQYERLLIKGHEPEVLLGFDETPGAVKTLNEWVDKGYNVSIITGRPFNSYEPSREWLDRHGLKRIKLYCLNKYGGTNFLYNTDYSLELEDYYKMHFDFAVEDSPLAFKYFNHLPNLKVLVFDRPWNHGHELPGDNYTRCFDWETIRKHVEAKEA